MKKRKVWALVLAVCMLMSIALIVPAGASDDKASVTFTASEPDANGYFTMTMNIKNAKFNAFQFVLRYDPATVQPVSYDTKEATDKFENFAKKADNSDWMSTVGTSINAQKGLIDFTGYVSPGESVAVGAEQIVGNANIGNEGLDIYTFSFKKISNADAVIELAVAEDGKASQSYLPSGGELYDAGDAILTTITVTMPESIGETTETESGSSGNATNNTENNNESNNLMTREERLNGTIFLRIDNYAAVVDGELVHIYPGEKNVVPYLSSDRTFVPLRFIAEELDAQVEWIAETRHVVIKRGGKTLDLSIDATTYTIDGFSHEMDAPAVIVNDRTMVPIRFVMEALGSAVEWDANNRMVIVSPSDAPWDLNGTLEKEIMPDVITVISALVRDFV